MKQSLRIFFRSGLAICFLTAVLLMAASAGDAYCADKKKGATISFRLTEKGQTEINMMLTFEPPPVEQIQEALNEALSCKIQNAKLEKVDVKSRYEAGDYDEDYEAEVAANEDPDVEGETAPSQSSGSQSNTDGHRPEVLLWTFTATSADAFPKHNFHIDGEIRLDRIADLFKSSGVSSLTVMLQHPSYGHSQCTQGLEPLSATQYGYHYYQVPVDGSAFQTIKVSFGYKTSDLTFALALPLSFLLFPIVLSLFLMRAALKSEADKRYAAWLRLWKATSWIAIVAWVGWSFIFSFRSLSEMLRLLPSGRSALHAGFSVGIYLIPPTFVIGLCTALMLAVHMRMRDISYTWRDLARHILVEQIGGILVLVLFSMGIGSLFSAPRQGILLLAGAVVASAILTSVKKRFLNLTPYALEVGQLRDQIFEMAKRCGVKLKQVYILSEDKMKTINAMAKSGDNLILTNALLEHLNKREVDAVVAHELGHLKHRHPKSLGTMFVVGIVLLSTGSGVLDSLFKFNFGFTIGVLIFLLAVSYFSRKFEYTADMHSAYLMGDPRPLISALAKMSRLSMLPMMSDRLSEMVSTHPYTKNRAEALGRFGNLSSEELQQLVAEPAVDQEHYNLASIAETNDRAFSTAAKQKISNRGGLILIASKTLTPALFAVIALKLGLTDSARVMTYLAGFIATTAIYLWLLNHVPVSGCKDMVKKLREKFEREGIGPKHQQGTFVGFSPDAEVRFYENNDDWDMGYLFTSGDRLCYVGEQTRFALRADQICEIAVASGSVNLWKSERVFISWLDTGQTAIKTFNLHPTAAHSLTDGSRKTRELAQSLRNWQSTSGEDAVMPALIDGLATPDIGEVTSRSHSEVMAPGKQLNLIFVMLFIATAVSLFLRLSFSPQRGGGALYVIAVTLFLTLLGMIPSLKIHRKKPAQSVQQQALESLEATK